MSSSRVVWTLVIASFSLASTAVAQEAVGPAASQSTDQHQWLAKFVGQWDTRSKGSTGPDQPPMQYEGTIESRMIGDLWVINEMSSVIQGTPMRGLQTIGYDPAKEKFVGTWVDSMINHLWQYEGTLDESANRLTLVAKGPSFLGDGADTQYRDIYEFETPDRIVLTSEMQDSEGNWVTFMTGQATRKKTDAPASDEQ